MARLYVELGFHIVATEGTANILERAGLRVDRVYKVKEGRPNVVDLIKGDRIQLIVNTPRGQDTFFDEKAIRRAAVLQRIPTITTVAAARAAAEGIQAIQRNTIRGEGPAAAAYHGSCSRIILKRSKDDTIVNRMLQRQASNWFGAASKSTVGWRLVKPFQNFQPTNVNDR